MTSPNPLFPHRLPEPRPVNWFQRVFFGRTNPAGASRAIQNLLATGERLDAAHIATAAKRFGVVRQEARKAVLIQVCAEALSRVLARTPSTWESGRQQVRALVDILGLNHRDFQTVEKTAARGHLRGAVKAAVADKVFSTAERAEVRELASALNLSQSELEELIRSEVAPLLQAAVEAALADRRYSPSEEAELNRLAADLGVDLELGANTAAAVEHFRTLWNIENGVLPEVSAPITLQRKEVCHFACPCSWRELRTRTVRVNYSGPTARIRIMKGVYWRMGAITPQRVTETNLTEVTSGTLYITSKRVILDGKTANKTVTWRSVFGQEIFSDAIKLEKTSGKDPYLFVPSSEIELASGVMAAAMAAAG